MILDKWKEKRHIENIRAFMRGLVLGFFIMIVMQKNITITLNLATIVILIMANIYFTAAYRLARKYEKYISRTHVEIKSKIDINMNDIFLLHKIDEFKRLGLSVLNDTIFDINGFYDTIVLVFAIAPYCILYNLYRLYTHVMSLRYCILLILIIAFFFINIVGLIALFRKINTRTKEFIIKEGWDKVWEK